MARTSATNRLPASRVAATNRALATNRNEIGSTTPAPTTTEAVFDGTSGYITIPDSDVLSVSENITISAWFKPSTLDFPSFSTDGANGKYIYPFGKFLNNSPVEYAFKWYLVSPTYPGTPYGTRDGRISDYLWNYNGAYGVGGYVTHEEDQSVAGNWIHLGMVVNKTTGLVYLYKNGTSRHTQIYNTTGTIAKCHATVSGGAVTEIVMDNKGSGYGFTPNFYAIPTNGGSGAAFTVNMVGGTVDSITVTNGGSGYNAAPDCRVHIDPDNTTAPLLIGTAGTKSTFFKGSIKDIRVYSSAKSAAEMAAIAGGEDDTTNLVAKYLLDSDVKDSVGTNHGTITGGVTFA